MSDRRPVNDDDTAAYQQPAKSCQNCHHFARDKNGPFCKMHYATELPVCVIEIVCVDHMMKNDEVHVVYDEPKSYR